MAKKISENEVLELYRIRKRDFEKAKTKKRRQKEALPDGMKTLVSDFFNKDSTTMRQIEEQRALMAWSSYVGEAGGRHSTAKRIRNGTVIIEVKDPLWMQELLFLKNPILKRFQRDFPKLSIRDLFLTRHDRGD